MLEYCVRQRGGQQLIIRITNYVHLLHLCIPNHAGQQQKLLGVWLIQLLAQLPG